MKTKNTLTEVISWNTRSWDAYRKASDLRTRQFQSILPTAPMDMPWYRDEDGEVVITTHDDMPDATTRPKFGTPDYAEYTDVSFYDTHISFVLFAHEECTFARRKDDTHYTAPYHMRWERTDGELMVYEDVTAEQLSVNINDPLHRDWAF